MQAPENNPWQRRLVAIAAAFLICYAAHGLTSTLLLIPESFGMDLGNAFMPIFLGLQCVIFLLALLWQLKITEPLRNFETATFSAGILLLLVVPVLIAIAVIEARHDTSPDRGAATAAFFMLIIFGGFYALQGIVAFAISFVLRKRRQAA